MKSYIKYIVVTVVLLLAFIIVYVSSRHGEYNKASNAPTTIQKTSTSVERITTTKKNVINSENSTTIADLETTNVKSEEMDRLLENYNKNAEIKITPEMVSKGKYNANTNITVGDVSIVIFDTESSLSIDYSYEGKDDEEIYPFFRDFSKIMNPSITNKIIKKAWKEIKMGNYINTSFYNLKGIEVTYITGEVDEENSHYIIRTKFNKNQ